jgi:hypothetical protein
MKVIAKIPRKTRIHNVLFFRDTPFKPKHMEPKTRYKRRQKHPQKTIDQ